MRQLFAADQEKPDSASEGQQGAVDKSAAFIQTGEGAK